MNCPKSGGGAESHVEKRVMGGRAAAAGQVGYGAILPVVSAAAGAGPDLAGSQSNECKGHMHIGL